MAQGKQRSVDASRFAMVPRSDIPRSSFDIRTSHKTTFDAGFLIPVYVDEVLPGESFRVRMTAFVRLATPLVPPMDNLHLDSFFFFVPNRLLWEHWERFMGEQISPTDITDFLTPQIEIADGSVPTGSLLDYLGLVDPGVGQTYRVSALPLRAYNRIWNDFFRDQDLQTKMPEYIDDGPDPITILDYTLMKRAKRHDYFTSARPWPQKPSPGGQAGDMGGPLVPGGRMLFPQSGAPVTGIGYGVTPTEVGPVNVYQTGGRPQSFASAMSTASSPLITKLAGGPFPDVRVLINDIRTANSVQLLMERAARGGTRYAEIVRDQFGVTSPDARLQRPEYLGGGHAQVVINPIAQTSASGATGSTTVLGELAGIGTAMANHSFSQSFTEHGVILGLVSVRADLTYQQGIERFWFRRTKWDFYTPALANLGEQAILSKEIFADGSANDEDVFGYQERWSEYKFKPGRISGRFRSSAPGPLDMWHFAQNFATRPVLNDEFIQEFPPVDRVLQVGGAENEQFLFDSVFDIRKVTAMPMFSIPGLGPRL